MTSEQQILFLNWVKDNTIKVSENTYLTQCTQYSKDFTYYELKKYYRKEFLN